MADKPDVNESIKSRLIMTAVFIATLVFLVVAMVFSWFTNNKSVSANGINVKVSAPELVEVEVLDEDKIPVTGLFELENIIPGGTKTFYISISNNNESSKTVDVLLSEITDGSEDSTDKLLDEITLTSKIGDNILNSISVFSDESVTVASDVTVAPGGAAEIECVFSMDEDADNNYQNLTAVFERIVVQP